MKKFKSRDSNNQKLDFTLTDAQKQQARRYSTQKFLIIQQTTQILFISYFIPSYYLQGITFMVQSQLNDEENIFSCQHDSKQKSKLKNNQLQSFDQEQQTDENQIDPQLFMATLQSIELASLSQVLKRLKKQKQAKMRVIMIRTKAAQLKMKQKSWVIKPQHPPHTSSIVNQTLSSKSTSQNCITQPQMFNFSEQYSSQFQQRSQYVFKVQGENFSQDKVLKKESCSISSKEASIFCDYFLSPYLESNQDRKVYRIQDYSTNQSSNISIDTESAQKFTAADYARCSGLIKSIWYNRYGQVEVVAYATGFAISPRIIVSCAHGIYDKKRSRPCDKIYFVPSHDHKGYIQKQNIYESPDHNFLKYEPLNQNQKYGTQPIEKDLAVFIINRPFKNDCYLQLCDEQIPKNASLKIWGYPSKQIPPLANLQGMKLKRVDLNGNFVQKRDKYILVHSMPTLGGHSGSPIVHVTDRYNNQSFKVVGIHTHRGDGDTNQGLIMSRKLKQKIFQFATELYLQHNIPLGHYDWYQYQKIIQWVK